MIQVRRLPDWVNNSYDLELYHHGIIGQKWGKMHGPPYPLERGISAAIKRHKEAPKIGFAEGRNADGTKKFKNDKRYQNANGTLNKEGKEKFGSYEEFDRQRREKAKKVLKAVAITAGVTLGAAAVYYGANKVRQEFIGQTIKNMRAQRITRELMDNQAANGRMYVADNIIDKIRYQAKYGAGSMGDTGKYAVNNLNIKNVKIAPNRVARKEFEKLYNSDKAFKDTVDKAINLGSNPLNFGMGGKQFDLFYDAKNGNMKKKYDAFNIANSFKLGGDEKNFDKFYNQLKKMGYSGIYDMNDNKYSGYNSRSAKILFSGSNAKITDQRIVEQGSKEFAKTKNKIIPLTMAEMLARDPSIAALVGIGGSASAAEAYNFAKAEKKKKQQKSE